MAQQQKAKSGGNRKHGRDKAKCERHAARPTRELRKAKRVLQSCGIDYFRSWVRTLPDGARGAVLKRFAAYM